MRAQKRIYTKMPPKPTSQLVILLLVCWNRPPSISQYPNMAQRLSGQTSICGCVFLCPSLFWELSDKRNWKKSYKVLKASGPCYNNGNIENGLLPRLEPRFQTSKRQTEWDPYTLYRFVLTTFQSRFWHLAFDMNSVAWRNITTEELSIKERNCGAASVGSITR